MRKRIFTWLGKEFIELSGEAKAAANATIEAQELFQRIDSGAQGARLVPRQHRA